MCAALHLTDVMGKDTIFLGMRYSGLRAIIDAPLRPQHNLAVHTASYACTVVRCAYSYVAYYVR